MSQHSQNPGSSSPLAPSRLRASLALAVTAVLLSACTPGGTDPVTQDASPGASAAATATEAPTAVSQLRSKVDTRLQELLAQSPNPSAAQLKTALAQAGDSELPVEVSVDRTPTGLAVDAITAATMVDHQCVFAQVRDGKASTHVLPALSSGGCFVGDQK